MYTLAPASPTGLASDAARGTGPPGGNGAVIYQVGVGVADGLGFRRGGSDRPGHADRVAGDEAPHVDGVGGRRRRSYAGVCSGSADMPCVFACGSLGRRTGGVWAPERVGSGDVNGERLEGDAGGGDRHVNLCGRALRLNGGSEAGVWEGGASFAGLVGYRAPTDHDQSVRIVGELSGESANGARARRVRGGSRRP